jgi:Tfp pilus assembly protein PilO
MDRNKLSLVVAGLAALAILAGGWFVGVQPQLAAASGAAQQRSDIEERNSTVRAELTRLQQQYAELGTLKSDLATLQASIPDTTDTTPFIKELDQLAATNGVVISSLTFGDAQAYVPPAAPATEGTDGAAATPAPSASAEPGGSASVAVSAPTTVTDPLITSSNFIVIPVSVAVDGTDAQALAFTAGVQDGARLFLVNSIGTGSTQGETTETEDTTATATTGTKTWTLSGFVFVLDSTAGTPAATPSATATNG